MNYTITKETSLMEFLLLHYGRKQVKLLFKYKQIRVNGQVNTQFNSVVSPGDTVSVVKQNSNTSLEILYEDKEIIVLNKPSGLLSMSNGQEKQKTAYHLVGEYLKQQDKKARVYIVHRLDRDTSGVLLFAKNEKIKLLLQDNWNAIVTKRGYLAIVEGQMKNKQGTIKNYLEESKTQTVYITKKGGKLAITNYQVVQVSKEYSLVEVFLDSGRKNQIRVHMQSLGNSIVGDKKYGATSNPIKRLGLHAHVFAFTHPITKKVMEFIAPKPDEFQRIFKKK